MIEKKEGWVGGGEERREGKKERKKQGKMEKDDNAERIGVVAQYFKPN